MSWIRRRTRKEEPPANRLPDLEFLALVRAGLEEFAPGVTQDAQLKGNSLISPQGWAVAVAPPHHGGGHHYDLVALPDVGLQPDVPCFMDCVVSMSADPQDAANTWVQTAGACLLELLDRREHFADHAGPDDERGVPGWHVITSGAVGLGHDVDENRRLQGALLEANVLHRIADSFTADLESPFFNGVKVFYGGSPGAMQAEVRVNGERHEAASAAMAALGLPEPTTFTTVRFYALLLPVLADSGRPSYRTARLDLVPASVRTDTHSHGAACACDCGGHLDPEHPGFDLDLPHLVAELSEEERERRVKSDTGAIIIAEGVGNFLKVRLPIRLDDGRTVVYLAWVYLQAAVIDDFVQQIHNDDLAGHRFEGLLCNAIGPWGEDVLRAPVVLGGQRLNEDGSIRRSEVLESSDPLLGKVLSETWPAAFVLGDRFPRSPSN
ncbi:DUF6348 family protein [Streptomyces triticiradicis]|uniref:DUF2199 domain-containing protein n=1 Tax=Streptomyces triticiradicis TaxID=2651189 RepID=A0A7J5D2C9_9ACTN|nr:DUF6348 family protein [Streptomyces triticiradicis]KAB1977577.1 DUF2199 domain-containing protein [Streptomyces triticiradicis]